MGKNRTFASGAKSFIGLLILLNGMSGIFILPSARSEETLETENSESQTIGLSENFYKTLDKVKKTGERKLECPKNSARLILPENNTVIETALAEAFISADSLAVIIQNKDTVAAYILVGKSANYLSRGGEKILIRPGHCAIITSPSVSQFSQVNPALFVYYRNLRERTDACEKVYEGEFEITSLLDSLASRPTAPRLALAIKRARKAARKQTSTAFKRF